MAEDERTKKENYSHRKSHEGFYRLWVPPKVPVAVDKRSVRLF